MEFVKSNSKRLQTSQLSERWRAFPEEGLDVHSSLPTHATGVTSSYHSSGEDNLTACCSCKVVDALTDLK